MTDLYSKNLQRYILYGVGSVLVGVLTALAQQLPGNDPIQWREVASSGISALLGVLTMALASTTLTRLGSESVAAQVNALREEGVHREDMVVIPKDEAPSPLTEADIGRLADELIRQTSRTRSPLGPRITEGKG